MQIIEVTPNNEQHFFTYVRGRELEFFFFLMDYKQYKDKCQMFMAINESKIIQGLMIIWREHTIQLRGNIRALKAEIDFLRRHNTEIHQITAPNSFQTLLSQYFPTYEMRFLMNRLVLKKGQENLCEKYDFEELTPSDSEKIARFLRNADPKYFGHHKAEDILMDENRPYFAVMKDGEIISIAGLWVDEQMGIINLIATHPDYRKQGYATSMVSTAVKWLFQRTNQIIIHVRAKNIPALHTYQKIGFKIKYTYDVITLQK